MRFKFFPSGPRDEAVRLALQPRVAPVGTLRVWVGLFTTDDDREPRSLRWSLDGRRVEARALHPGTSSSESGLAPAHEHGARAHTGVFELGRDDGVEPGRRHRVMVHEEDGASAVLEIESLPEQIPSALDDSFRVLMVSCFHQHEDRQGLLGQMVAELGAKERPHVGLLMGDQVYLDLPTLADFPDEEAALARRFERDYRLNWGLRNGYSRVLTAAPSVASPDDHEFWNNYPHRSPMIQNSWTPEGRDSWRRAAESLYGAFQQAHPAALGDPLTIEVPPLSILVLDQRSKRRDDRSSSLAPGVLDQVSSWVDERLATKTYGAVVTGQSLLDPPTHPLKGKVADWSLADYADHRPLMAQLERLSDAGRPVLLLTGDVHWGRVTEIRRGGRVRFLEVICSPSSLVSTIGADQLKGLGAGMRRMLGGSAHDPWWRFADPEDGNDAISLDALRPGHHARVVHGQKGNQVALLDVRRRGGGLQLVVTYHPIEPSQPPCRVGPFDLPPH